MSLPPNTNGMSDTPFDAFRNALASSGMTDDQRNLLQAVVEALLKSEGDRLRRELDEAKALIAELRQERDSYRATILAAVPCDFVPFTDEELEHLELHGLGLEEVFEAIERAKVA